MATRKIKYVLSEETDLRYKTAMQQLDQFKKAGWAVSDAAREEEDDGNGNKVPVGVIIVTR